MGIKQFDYDFDFVDENIDLCQLTETEIVRLMYEGIDLNVPISLSDRFSQGQIMELAHHPAIDFFSDGFKQMIWDGFEEIVEGVAEVA